MQTLQGCFFTLIALLLQYLSRLCYVFRIPPDFRGFVVGVGALKAFTHFRFGVNFR